MPRRPDFFQWIATCVQRYAGIRKDNLISGIGDRLDNSPQDYMSGLHVGLLSQRAIKRLYSTITHTR